MSIHYGYFFNQFGVYSMLKWFVFIQEGKLQGEWAEKNDNTWGAPEGVTEALPAIPARHCRSD